jgi:hypothetical protein
VVAILVCVLKCRTQIWKRTTQESFQQSLVEIGSVVSEEKIFFKFHPPTSIMMSFLTYITGYFMNFELLPILTHYANKKKGEGTHPGTIPARFGLIWFSGFREYLNVIFYQNMPNLHNQYTKIVSVDPDFQPRWPSS